MESSLNYCEITSNDFCFAQHSKNSTCVTENPKKKQEIQAIMQETGRKLQQILRLPPNAGELTANMLIHSHQLQLYCTCFMLNYNVWQMYSKESCSYLNMYNTSDNLSGSNLSSSFTNSSQSFYNVFLKFKQKKVMFKTKCCIA